MPGQRKGQAIGFAAYSDVWRRAGSFFLRRSFGPPSLSRPHHRNKTYAKTNHHTQSPNERQTLSIRTRLDEDDGGKKNNKAEHKDRPGHKSHGQSAFGTHKFVRKSMPPLPLTFGVAKSLAAVWTKITSHKR